MPSRGKPGREDDGARAFVPRRPTLNTLRRAVNTCQGCELYRNATQAVFGEGPRSAPLMLIGEQPGDQEDLQGKPFVGPAGKLLDRALEAAGISRDAVYVTNAVKHFRWLPRGKRRLHQRPLAGQVSACLPWLEEELKLVKPQVVLCLGATAAQALLGRDFRIGGGHGEVRQAALAPRVIATAHPSSILRLRDAQERESAFGKLLADLKTATRLLKRS